MQAELRDQFNYAGRSGFFDMKISPGYLAQKHQANQVKWNEILKNKEMNVQLKHKKLKDQLTKKTKFEKEAGKRLKEEEMKWKFDIDKKKEKYASTVTR